MGFIEKSEYTINDLIQIMRLLRSQEGCPWDREQTHESLKITVLEESYEVIEAINNKDQDNLLEELGDLLLQVVFHATIAEENNDFSMGEVITGLCKKLIHRHPHVFLKENISQSDEVIKQWDLIKKQEKNHKTVADVVKAIPKALPALVRAEKVQKKAAKVGFDFPNIEGAFSKVYEEMDELKEAKEKGSKEEIDEEFGDLMFSLVNLSRFFDLNAEFSLTNAIEKFITRFEGVENLAAEQGKKLEELSIQEMDMLWGRIK